MGSPSYRIRPAVVAGIALLLAGCQTGADLIEFNDRATKPSASCAALEAERSKLADEIADWQNAGRARDVGVGVGIGALMAGIASGGIALGLSAGLTVAERVNVDLSDRRERLRFLSYERARRC